MGEIADALKKANAERNRARDTAAESPPPVAPDADAVAADWGMPAREPAPSPVPPSRSSPPAPRPADEVHPPPPTPRPGDEMRSPRPTPLERTTDPAPASEGADESSLPAIELDGEAPQVDHIRHLALRLRSEMERRDARSVLVTSALRDEGKTTVSCRLAIALASVSSGRGIALVDLDMRNPSVCKRLGFRPPHGISEVMLGEIPLETACHPFREPRLDVYPSGQHRPAAHEILAGEGFARVLDALHARYEFVVIDSPPTLLVPDSTLILRHADCCVTVAHAGITRVRLFRKMLDLLPAERIVGKILNGARTEKHERAYYQYGYGVEDESESTPREGQA